MTPSSKKLEVGATKSADAPSISTPAGVDDMNAYWPSSLAHLERPYESAGSEYVTLGEVSDAAAAGFVGYRKVSVALVPHALVEQVLHSTSLAGYEVRSHGPLPIVDDDDAPHESGFWIEGVERDTRFEPLINSWRGGETDVVIPDSSMLMAFGLVPRQTNEFEMSWDDPRGPVYDVVRVSAVFDHHRPKELRQRAYVEIRRDYLLEYCRIKQCAAIAFFYEQRRSDADATFDGVIGAAKNVDFNLPGRLLNLQVHPNRSDGHGRQLAQVWGRRLVLARGERRIIEVGEPELVWPDHAGIMTMERASREHLFVYVKDEVLKQYENRQEFEIYPLSGGVSYRGQWSVSYGNRVGREHISVEVKKLYEGSRNEVIEHWHKFSVPRSSAEEDRSTNGDRSIALRAEELVRAYLALTGALVQVAERLGLGFDQSEVGGYDSADVAYRGWWTIAGLSSLANVAPMSITLDGFLDRTIDIVILWESLKESPIRNILLQIGFDKKIIAGLRTMKLLAVLCQISKVCKEGGHRWPEDAGDALGAWDGSLRIPSLNRLFALNQLRLKAAHRVGDGFSGSLAIDLKAFGIVPAAHVAGWGRAVDVVYDGLIEDITEITALIVPTE